MGSIGGEELKKWEKLQGMMADREEKILVLVRLRPLNEKEIAKSEVGDWECINDSTVLYRNSLQERSGLPTAYSFDRVFSGDCATKQVYEEGTKEIALSVVNGINSSVFAYGQTSSGKTYTMNGITEYTVADIYDHIQRHEERAFVMKFSAMEIYNENVRDLLSSDNTQLRLLDDPEKGTVVEKLTEETLKDWDHLKKLIAICEAQRKIGETSLNETSSRSHQILKLTIESSAREFLNKEKSSTLSASVFFIDLAGSERASQAMSAGTRLKEGCHINRSLLTLGNVIRKLSKGRQGHINYRDSKLTRILQPCLGGNARTSIICTLSPARSHVEQSRNTLLFASCAKQVSTNAKVNVVMSDKALVKHLRKELARLENELKSPAPNSSSCNCATTIKKKDLQIEKMEKEIRELSKQRDLAQSRIEDLLLIVGNDQAPSRLEERRQIKWEGEGKWDDEQTTSELSEVDHYYQNGGDTNSSKGIRRRYTEGEENRVTDAGEDLEERQWKEVQCIAIGEASSMREVTGNGHVANGEGTRGDMRQNGFSYDSLEQGMHDVQRSIQTLADAYSEHITPSSSRSHRREPPREEYSDKTPPAEIETDFAGRLGFVRRTFPPLDYGASPARLLRNDSRSSVGTEFVDDARSQSGKNGMDDEIPTIGTFVAGLRDAKLHYEKQLRDCQVWDSGAESDDVGKCLIDLGSGRATPLDWSHQFERLQRSIIELWHACNVSLVHRTYFFLLFKGDPSDSIYLEVELRRLSFIKDTTQGNNGNMEDRQSLTLTSRNSLRSLRREKETLSKLVNKRFSKTEKQKLYEEWGVSLDSKKRRLQLVSCLWTDTEDINHAKQSAAVVAKLVKFSQQGRALKEMFGLSFAAPRSVSRRSSFGWKVNRLST